MCIRDSLNSAAFTRLSRYAQAVPLGPVRVNTANGTTTLNVFLVDYVQVGDSYVENLHIAVADLGESGSVEGLLGMNFLGQYRFEVDQNAEVLYLEPR